MSDFEELSNPWSEYRLPCGRKVKVRHILTTVKYVGQDADGITPKYDLTFQAVAVTEPSETIGNSAQTPFLIKKSDLQ